MLKPTLVWLRNTLLDVYYWPLSRRRFIAQLADVHSPQDALSLTFRYQGYGHYKWLRASQHQAEITCLVERVQSIHPAVIVEIGTRDGGTLCIWSQCSPRLELLVSIDLPGGIHGGGYPVQRARFYRLFTANHPKCQLNLLRQDSQTESTRARLVELLHGRPIDFLFIDGDHRYAGVKKDYELYANLVHPGGLIAFHDIRPNAEQDSIEVYKLWDEIKRTEKHTEEIVHEPYTGRFGIGLLTKSN